MNNKLNQKFIKLSRRAFNTLLGASGLAAVGSTQVFPDTKSNRAHILVIGGGFGGATAAKYLKIFEPSLSITLIEPSRWYVSCPFSNTVITGINKFSYIINSFENLKNLNIKIIHEFVLDINADNKEVTLSNQEKISFDLCIVSPGIDFRYENIIGSSENINKLIPHAWKAGVQTQLLRNQLLAMPNGGTFLISPPPTPFRCPPGPAERISLVAHYFKKYKPNSKIIVLDPKKKFGKQKLFKEGWEKLYPNMIEYRNVNEFGTVREISADKMMLITDVDEVKGNVINFIPAQKAGKIAFNSGLTDDSGWCPVNHQTFESKLQKGIYVIGDASIVNPMPKSGVAAYSQAQACAAAIIAKLRGKSPRTSKLINYCYSLVAPDYGISVAMLYKFDGESIKKIEGAGGYSPTQKNTNFRKREALYAKSWYESMTKEIWG